jgi:hypothetical protein
MKKKGVVISLVVVIALLMVLIIGSMFSKDSKSDDKKNDNKTENEVTENNEETIMFGEVLQYLYFEDNKYILFSQDTNGGIVISSSVDSNTAKVNTENYTTMKAIGSKVDGNNVTIGILMSDANENTKAYIINIDKKNLNKEITSNSSVALNNISNSILPVNFDKAISFIGIYKKDKKENIMLVSDSEFYLVNNKGETSVLVLGESEK